MFQESGDFLVEKESKDFNVTTTAAFVGESVCPSAEFQSFQTALVKVQRSILFELTEYQGTSSSSLIQSPLCISRKQVL